MTYILKIANVIFSKSQYLSYEFLKLILAYFVGILFHNFQDFIYKYQQRILLIMITTTMGFAIIGKLVLILPLSLGMICLIVFGSIKLTLKQDYSYGIYIYSFPIQILILVSKPNISLIPHIILSSILTIALAFMSYNLIEKPAMKMKNSLSFHGLKDRKK